MGSRGRLGDKKDDRDMLGAFDCGRARSLCRRRAVGWRVETAAARACRRERGSRGTRRGGLTYGGDDEENEECVEHGHDGGGERRHDVAERAHAAEEADDAEGAQRPDRVDRHADGPQSHERQQDDDAVEDIPAVLQEGVEPVGVGVDDELDGEDEGEEHIHALQADAGGGEAAVAVCERVGELRLCCVHGEVLPEEGVIYFVQMCELLLQ